jgi:hypothetical protein
MANLWEGNALKAAFIRLGLTDVAAREFMENGVTDVHQLRSLSKEALARLIKQIQCDNHGGAGLVIPFMSQEYIQAMLFWIHRQHLLIQVSSHVTVSALPSYWPHSMILIF